MREKSFKRASINDVAADITKFKLGHATEQKNAGGFSSLRPSQQSQQHQQQQSSSGGSTGTTKK